LNTLDPAIERRIPVAEEKTPTTSDEEKDVEGHGPYAPVTEPVTERDAALDDKEDDVEGHGYTDRPSQARPSQA
jgi:hypothetical protein